MRSRFASAVLLTAGLLLVAAWVVPRARADGPGSPQQRELRIERSLACPQCTDLPLDVCDQDICNDMRSIIHQKVAAGESDAAIRDFFVERYGARVLLSPPKTPATLLAWLMPFVALAVGAVAVLVFVRAATHRAKATAPDLSRGAAASGYRSRVELDLHELE